LKKTNQFFAWKNEALDAAEFAYFKDILTGTDEDKLGLRYSQLDERRRKVVGFLFLRNSVDSQYHDLINGAHSPVEAWENIVNKFDRKTRSNVQPYSDN
jgi:hypothetical protein